MYSKSNPKIRFIFPFWLWTSSWIAYPICLSLEMPISVYVSIRARFTKLSVCSNNSTYASHGDIRDYDLMDVRVQDNKGGYMVWGRLKLTSVHRHGKGCSLGLESGWRGWEREREREREDTRWKRGVEGRFLAGG